ncbi:hypothetical protein [Tannockella kyphosi]|uniref:hypothetical protein n=1 Tax=Tannockella kyphosi TaxID=2899121 RepID=UPI002013439B|nr:hypothetical protein [Tannockella kyphosi]
MDVEIDSLCSKNDYRAPKPLEIKGNKNNEDKATKMGKKDFQYDEYKENSVLEPVGVEKSMSFFIYENKCDKKDHQL